MPFFLLVPLRFFSLSLVLSDLIMRYLGVVFFVFLCLGFVELLGSVALYSVMLTLSRFLVGGCLICT